MKISIDNIHIHNLRGIRDISISLAGTNLLIVGENGTGKSSIVDAVELFFTKNIDKFAGRADIQKAEVIPFIGSNSDRRVGLTLVSDSGNKDSIELIYSRPPVYSKIPDTLGDFFSLAAQRPFILHRYQLMRFIEEHPAERYKSLSALIGMEQLDDIVRSWRKVLGQVEKEKETAEQEAQHYLREVRDWVKHDISTDSEICELVNLAIIPLGLVSITERPDIVTCQNVLKGKFTRPINFARAEVLRTAKSRLGDLGENIHALLSAYAALYQVWQVYLEKSAKISDAPFEQILSDGRKLIDEKELDYCPLCEHEIDDRGKLIDCLDKRLQGLHELIHLRQDVSVNKLRLQKSVLRAQDSLSRVRDSFAAAAIQDFATFHEITILLRTLEAKADADIILLDSPDVIQQSLISQQYSDEHQNMFGWIDAQLAELNPNETEQTILNTNDFLARLDEKWMDWQEKRQIAFNSFRKHEQVQLLCATLIEARKRGIQRILDDLQDEFIRIYNLIHPGEGHKAISILMDENKANSAELYAEVYGIQAMHPLGHYSEGHLDSMGLCIFLALIKKFNCDLKFIFLDDVLTSIDSGHRMRVAKLIVSEFREYQIILTTHDEFWANELSMVFANNSLALKMIRMNPWNQEDGATHNDYAATDWKYYLNKITEGQKQDAIAGVGRTLERFLFTMRKNLHIAIPANFDDRYTIGDLYEPFFTWVDKHPIVRQDISDFKQRISLLKQELDDYWRFRNWSGAHYNEWGAGVSSDEAKIYVELIRDLVVYFECPACSNLVFYDVSKKVVHCPICKPNPLAKGVWVYKSNWKQIALRLKVAEHIADKDINVIRISQAAIENYLKDARRKLGLTIQATANDEYGLPEIYDAFVDFATTHPKLNDADSQGKIKIAIETLAEFITPERNWIEAQNVRNKSENLLSAAMGVTEFLECSACGELICFDHKEQVYYCAKCDKKEVLEVPGAHWFIA